MRPSGRAAGVWAPDCRLRCSNAATSSSCCSAAVICSGSSAYLQAHYLPVGKHCKQACQLPCASMPAGLEQSCRPTSAIMSSVAWQPCGRSLTAAWLPPATAPSFLPSGLLRAAGKGIILAPI